MRRRRGAARTVRPAEGGGAREARRSRRANRRARRLWRPPRQPDQTPPDHVLHPVGERSPRPRRPGASRCGGRRSRPGRSSGAPPRAARRPAGHRRRQGLPPAARRGPAGWADRPESRRSDGAGRGLGSAPCRSRCRAGRIGMISSGDLRLRESSRDPEPMYRDPMAGSGQVNNCSPSACLWLVPRSSVLCPRRKSRGTRGYFRVPGTVAALVGAGEVSSFTSVTWKGFLFGVGDSVVAWRGAGSGSENSGLVSMRRLTFVAGMPEQSGVWTGRLPDGGAGDRDRLLRRDQRGRSRSQRLVNLVYGLMIRVCSEPKSTRTAIPSSTPITRPRPYTSCVTRLPTSKCLGVGAAGALKGLVGR